MRLFELLFYFNDVGMVPLSPLLKEVDPWSPFCAQHLQVFDFIEREKAFDETGQAGVVFLVRSGSEMEQK